MARWRWTEDGFRYWDETGPVQAGGQRVLQPAQEEPAAGFREHKTTAGVLWVPEGTRTHDVPFGFRPERAQ